MMTHEAETLNLMHFSNAARSDPAGRGQRGAVGEDGAEAASGSKR